MRLKIAKENANVLLKFARAVLPEIELGQKLEQKLERNKLES